jgi:hypothetical protein
MHDFPIRHVLYCHYGAFEKDDFAEHGKGCPAAALPGVKHLQNHLQSLKELLTTPGHEGMLVIFYYAAGLPELVQGIEARLDKEQLLERWDCLRFAAGVADEVRKILAERGLADRVRFLTPVDLLVILGKAHSTRAQDFHKYLIGSSDGIRYDTPKIVESIIRLRLLGNGVPVLRVDYDVPFRFPVGKKAIGDLGLFKAIACATHAYQLRLADHTVSTFIFSASYNTRALRDKDPEVTRFEAWSRAFATRVHPALIANPAAMTPASVSGESEQPNWDKYVESPSNLDESLVRKFFGLRDEEGTLEPDGNNGITAIGAHPFYAVISGALLCLSEGAILDLPPFSNFRHNVMWIDDHLKYSLHRALDHFTSNETLNLEPGLSDARLDEVGVTKGRPPVADLPQYVFGNYLPTLLWGSIMDSWITIDPILKRRVSGLTPEEKDKWRSARSMERTAPLPKAILTALQSGDFRFQDQRILRTDLERLATIRIENVRKLWAALRSGKGKSFACYWAEGTVERSFGPRPFREMKDGLWQGIAPNQNLDTPITSTEQLNPAIAKKLAELIDDAVIYIDWVIHWPEFIQIVRSVPQGTFQGDLSWRSSSALNC